MKVWVLTEEHNEYDQHGEYFVKVFKSKPDHQKLAEVLGYKENASYNVMQALALIEHILKGGGRRDTEHHWYNLEEVEAL